MWTWMMTALDEWIGHTRLETDGRIADRWRGRTGRAEKILQSALEAMKKTVEMVWNTERLQTSTLYESTVWALTAASVQCFQELRWQSLDSDSIRATSLNSSETHCQDYMSEISQICLAELQSKLFLVCLFFNYQNRTFPHWKKSKILHKSLLLLIGKSLVRRITLQPATGHFEYYCWIHSRPCARLLISPFEYDRQDVLI